MGKRIVTVLELLIAVTLFAMFAALIVTTSTNDDIIEKTENFVELVRYKGCITDDMYDEFLDSFNVPVDISFEVTRQPSVLDANDALADGGGILEFTGDVINAIEDDHRIPANTYTMDVGDQIEVVVRKASPNFYDGIVGMLTGAGASSDRPAIAIKGGMILNTQYQTPDER